MSFYTTRFIQQMQKANAELELDFQPRQSTRYRDEAVFTSSVKRKDRKARRTRIDVPVGPQGAFIASIIQLVKASSKNS